jgi:uncharacterized protein (DUF2141 family)
MPLSFSRPLAMFLLIPFVALLPIGSPINGVSARAAEAAPSVDLSLTFHVRKQLRGTLVAGVFDSKAAYAAEKAVDICRINVTADRGRCVVRGLKVGPYAIKVFHDLNGNGKLDMNLVGMPTEPVAFSNNAKVNMRAPTWGEAMINVSPTLNSQSIDID